MLAKAGKRQFPSKEAWAAHKERITTLYKEEGKTLKQVMAIMERDHNFSATVKMYKSRITEWGIDKKLKGDEILAVLRMRAERDAQGRRTEFWTARGSKLDMGDIERYLQRNPSMLLRYHSGAEPSPEAAARIICRSPSPEPSSSAPPRLSSTIPTPRIRVPHVSSPLPGPHKEEERTLRIVSDYIRGSFEAHTWNWQLDVDCNSKRPGALDRLEKFRGNIYLASECYYGGDRHYVIGFANMACSTLQEILLDEHPKLIPSLCRVIALIRRSTKGRRSPSRRPHPAGPEDSGGGTQEQDIPDFLASIGRFAIQLSRVVLGPSHPITLVLVYIFSNLGNPHVMDWAARMFHLSWETFEETAGADNYFLVHLFREYRQTMITRPRFWDGVENELHAWMNAHPKECTTHLWLKAQMYQHRAWDFCRTGKGVALAESTLNKAKAYIASCQAAGWPVRDLIQLQSVIEAEIDRAKANEARNLYFIEALKTTLHIGDAQEELFRTLCMNLAKQWKKIYGRDGNFRCSGSGSSSSSECLFAIWVVKFIAKKGWSKWRKRCETTTTTTTDTANEFPADTKPRTQIIATIAVPHNASYRDGGGREDATSIGFIPFAGLNASFKQHECWGLNERSFPVRIYEKDMVRSLRERYRISYPGGGHRTSVLKRLVGVHEAPALWGRAGGQLGMDVEARLHSHSETQHRRPYGSKGTRTNSLYGQHDCGIADAHWAAVTNGTLRQQVHDRSHARKKPADNNHSESGITSPSRPREAVLHCRTGTTADISCRC
ncbi:hypothetical protein MKZ38_001175 [Zalerion maritima]|uniref:Clr5 domain-containing protein n=1 Tax=Zalerion maritima TaxID=339359 RepID=A0AAD5RXL7_9PEZI|nr:hypothetical protein MKZ38_001175 [Zalerion maritima]